jgi:integrase
MSIGCRPFSHSETKLILHELRSERDKTMFIMGLYTGFRISEILSLRWQDILTTQNDIVDRIKVKRINMKGSISSRDVFTHPILKRHLMELYGSIRGFEGYKPCWYVFSSKNMPERPISRIMAHKILSQATKKLGLQGSLGLHSMRKTYAENVYSGLGKDLYKTAKALGHRNISSTVSYLSFKTEEIDNAILGIFKDEENK